MSKPYIDQSTGENNQKEFSIHGLSKKQFEMIQYLLTVGTRVLNENKQIEEVIKKFVDKDAQDKISEASSGAQAILDYDIK